MSIGSTHESRMPVGWRCFVWFSNWISQPMRFVCLPSLGHLAPPPTRVCPAYSCGYRLPAIRWRLCGLLRAPISTISATLLCVSNQHFLACFLQFSGRACLAPRRSPRRPCRRSEQAISRMFVRLSSEQFYRRCSLFEVSRFSLVV